MAQRSIRSGNAELDRLLERRFHGRARKQSKRVRGDGAIVPSALDGILDRAMLHHQTDGVLEICIGGIRILKRTPPEFPFALRSASERKHDGQRDLAFAKIIADILAELYGLASIVERVIDQLEGDAQIHAERSAGGLLVPRP